MKQKKVSVVIPTFNRARYLPEAIDSVLAQTNKDDIEIVVVDDGSTDDTVEKLKPYKNDIMYTYIENGGPARARNVGMGLSSGKYISFLDSDDHYYPYKTEAQAAFLDRHSDVGLVCTEFSAFSDKGILDEFHLKKYHRSAYLGPHATYEKIYSKCISIAEAGLNLRDWKHKNIYVGNVYQRYYDELILATNTVMFRRELFEKIGPQNEQYWVFEDYEFMLRMTKASKVGFIDVPTYKLRYHDSQLSSVRNKANDKAELLIKKHANLIDIAEKHGLDDKDYYSRNRASVDKKLHSLNRAFAITLMQSSGKSKTAREHLKKCATHHKPEYMLWLLSLSPHAVRKMSFKLKSLLGLVDFNC